MKYFIPPLPGLEIEGFIPEQGDALL